MRKRFGCVRIYLHFALILAAIGGLAGCREKVQYQVKEPSPATNAPPTNQVSVPTNANPPVVPPTPTAFCFFVEGFPKSVAEAPKISEISILTSFTVAVELHGLTQGQKYTVMFEGYDGEGKSVLSADDGPVEFLASEPTLFTYFPCTPDPANQKPGKWKWIVRISDVGTPSADLIVYAPRPEVALNLANYEKARENALRAFSWYWLGLDGTFHTIVRHKSEQPTLNKMNRASFAKLKQRETELTTTIKSINAKNYGFYGSDDPKYREATKELQTVRDQINSLRAADPSIESNNQPDEYNGYLQISGVEWSLSQGEISEADRLNGIEWRGSAAFGFRVFRFYREDGWSDWEDSVRFSNRFAEFSGRFSTPTSPLLDSRLKLRFSILERDGNWFVTENGGDEFVNGKQIKDVSNWKNEKPELQYAMDLVSGAKSFTRDSYREMARLADQSPPALEQSTLSTMNMLRGRALIR